MTHVQRETYINRLLHLVLRERRVNDKVAIVRYDRSGLFHAHAQCQAGLAIRQTLRRAELPEVGEDLGVGKGDDLDGDALCPLYVSGSATFHRRRCSRLQSKVDVSGGRAKKEQVTDRDPRLCPTPWNFCGNQPQ